MSDSDSDDEPSKKKVSIGPGESQKRQARIAQENALKEDPTIYQYDELYDEINTNREEAKKAKTTEVRSSKYIERLLVTADKRKKEYERRVERQVQKEREVEGDKFKDKETFVTASYRAKLEAMRLEEEAERREEYLENIGDVTKQRDLGGFYRHLYEQKLGPEKVQATSTETFIEKKSDDKNSKKQRSYRKHNENEEEEEEVRDAKLNETKGDDETVNKKIHLQSNLDADSDFSIDSDSDEEDKSSIKPEEKDAEMSSDAVQVKIESKDTENIHEFAKPEPVDIKLVSDTEAAIEDKKPEKPKIDIWKKRTVGEAFDGALQRYYERKQLRCQ